MTLLHWLSVFLTILGLIAPAIATATPLTKGCGQKQLVSYGAKNFLSPPVPTSRCLGVSLNPLLMTTSPQPLNQLTAPERPQPQDTYTGFNAYPLPAVAPVLLDYGWYQEPKTDETRFHSGIDLQAEVGTPVLSVDVGTVAFAGEQGSYGNLVVVNHQGGRQTRYAHLQDVFVRAGQKVKPQDKLGTVGSTGRPDISKPHLHFELRYSSPQGWVAQDPKPNLQVQPTTQK